MADLWCGGSDNFIFTKDGPSECFCYTIFVLVPALVILLYLVLSYSGYLMIQQTQGSNHSSQRWILWILVIGSILQPILFAAFSSIENISPAKITGVGIHFLAWLMCALSLYYNFHNRLQWPCLAVTLYFSTSMAVCVIIVASVYSDRRVSTAFILGVLTFLHSLFVFLLSSFKDSLSPSSEVDTKYSAIYSSSVSVASSGASKAPPPFFVRFFGGNKSTDQRDDTAPFLQHSNGSDDEEGSHRLSDPTLSSSSNRWSNASEDISLVRSMRETRLVDGESSKAKPPTPPRPIVQSRVLSRMLEHPQGALNTKSKGVLGGLAPRASHPRQDPSSMGEFSAAARAKATDNRSDLLPREQIDHLESIRLLVEKWGLRRQGYGHEEKVLDDSDEDHRQQEREPSERFSSIVHYDDDKMGHPSLGSALQPLDELDENSVTEESFPPSASQPSHVSAQYLHSSLSPQSTGRGRKHQRGNKPLETTIPLLSRSTPSDPLGIPMEVEFEISLQTSEETEDNKVEKWAVWRTAKELLSLHAVLV
jgi:hypothetical protein